MTPTLEQLDALAEAIVRRPPQHGVVLRALAACFGVPLSQDDAVVLRHERLPADEARAAMEQLEAALPDPSPAETPAPPGRSLAELRAELLRLASKATPGTLRSPLPSETAFEASDLVSDDGGMPLVIGTMNENLHYGADRDYLCAAWNAVPKLLEALVTLEAQVDALRAQNTALENPPFGTRKIG